MLAHAPRTALIQTWDLSSLKRNYESSDNPEHRKEARKITTRWPDANAVVLTMPTGKRGQPVGRKINVGSKGTQGFKKGFRNPDQVTVDEFGDLNIPQLLKWSEKNIEDLP